MVRAGVEEVFLALGYRSEDVVRALGEGDGFGARVIFAYEDQPMGTAGAVKLLEDRLDDTFLVGSGDTLTDADLSKLTDLHFRSGAVATMGLTEVERPEQFGIVGMDQAGRIERFKEKPKTEEVFSNVINAGTYVLEKEALAHIPAGTKYDFSKNLFPDLLSKGRPIYAGRLDGYWKDIGNPADLLQANLAMAERHGEPTFLPGMVTEGPILATEVLGEGAEIVGPTYLGEGVTLERGSVVRASAVGRSSLVGRGASIEHSLLLDGCIVHAGAKVLNCILGEGCIIGPGVLLEGSVLGDKAQVDGPESLR
jgi:mannose-1-phosphate guanylyltransferase